MLFARGPYGGRPLYFAAEGSNQTLLVSSRLEPIVRSLDRPVALDEDRLAALLAGTAGLNLCATVYRGVSRLQSCEVARVTREGMTRVTRRPRWTAAPVGSADDMAAELFERISCVVDRSVGSFSKVAVMAGGGLDSSGLLATLVRRAQRVSDFTASAYAIDYPADGDDRPHLAVLAKHLSLQPHRIKPAEAVSLVPNTFVVDAAPLHGPTSPFFVLAARRAQREGAAALLTGWGGDLLFDGNMDQFIEQARTGDWLGAVRDVARLELLWRSSPLRQVRDYLLRPILKGALPPSWYATFWRLRIRRSEKWGWARGRLRETMSVPENPPELDWRDAVATAPGMDDAAEERGQHEVAFGIPRLDPYLDPEIAEFMTSLPQAMLVHGHRLRGLYRLAMQGVLPESVRMRRDKAEFEPAIRELFDCAAGQAEFRRLLRMEALGDLGLLEPRLYREALARSLKDHREWLEWPPLAIEAFVQKQQGTRAGLSRQLDPPVAYA
jgi:asparagine synthase (glutamine-hydrolysing)